MIFEYRRYDILPGRTELLKERFANHVIPLMEAHGIDRVGFWQPVIGVTSEFHYMLRFDDMADREQKFNAFVADPGWKEINEAAVKAGTRVNVRQGYYQLWREAEFPKGVGSGKSG